MKDLLPRGGVTYNDAKKAAQEIANKEGKPVRLWFNVGKNDKPETINPDKSSKI